MSTKKPKYSWPFTLCLPEIGFQIFTKNIRSKENFATIVRRKFRFKQGLVCHACLHLVLSAILQYSDLRNNRRKVSSVWHFWANVNVGVKLWRAKSIKQAGLPWKTIKLTATFDGPKSKSWKKMVLSGSKMVLSGSNEVIRGLMTSCDGHMNVGLIGSGWFRKLEVQVTVTRQVAPI